MRLEVMRNLSEVNRLAVPPDCQHQLFRTAEEFFPWLADTAAAQYPVRFYPDLIFGKANDLQRDESVCVLIAENNVIKAKPMTQPVAVRLGMLLQRYSPFSLWVRGI